VVVLTQSVARKPFHAKCKIKKTNKTKGFSLNLATFGTSPTVGLPSAHRALFGLRRLHAVGAKVCSYSVELFLASVGFMPSGPRFAATEAMLRVCFSSAARRRKKRKGWGRIVGACSVAASYASAGTSPTVGLPSAHRALLGLRRLHAVGAKTCSYRGHVAGLFFFRRKAAEEKKGLGPDRRAHAL